MIDDELSGEESTDFVNANMVLVGNIALRHPLNFIQIE